MQQRSTTSSSRAPEEKCINVLQEETKCFYSPRNSTIMDDSIHHHQHQLPVYFRSFKSSPFKKLASEKLVHALPFVVLLCIFTLWWFSYPVNLEINDRKIVAIHRIEMPQNLDNNHVELAILASLAMSPVAAVPQNTTISNEAEAHPASKID